MAFWKFYMEFYILYGARLIIDPKFHYKLSLVLYSEMSRLKNWKSINQRRKSFKTHLFSLSPSLPYRKLQTVEFK